MTPRRTARRPSAWLAALVLTMVLGFFQNRLREIAWPMEMTDEPGRGVLLREAKRRRTSEIRGRRRIAHVHSGDARPRNRSGGPHPMKPREQPQANG
jgi:hypothetical protein